jgi:hypothetical protein
MSTELPSSRLELLHALASILLDDQIEGTFAFALSDDANEPGAFNLFLRELAANDPIGSLYGFRAPPEWDAFGVVTSGTARPVGVGDDRPPRAVRVVYLLDRRGDEVSMAKDASDTNDRHAARPMLVDLCGPPETCGRVPDTCRRVLGLPTPPPSFDPASFWSIDWLDRVLTEVLRRDLDAPRLSWSAVERLHRGRSSDVAPWAILRRECASGQLAIGGLSPSTATWMDDGMFSRQVVASYPELHELLADLADLLPVEVWQKLVDRLRREQLV